MRFVIDTNVILESLTQGVGPAARLIEAVRRGAATLIVSRSIIGEYETLLHRLYGQREDRSELDAIEDWLATLPLAASPPASFTSVSDPDDQKFLDLAEAERVDALVTLDAHLLNVAGETLIPILTPMDAVARLEREHDPEGQSAWEAWMGPLLRKK